MRKASLVVTALLVIGIGTVALASVPAEAEKGSENHRTGILEGVLADLVADGTISQDQSDAVLEALKEKKEEISRQREEARELLKSFWEDGVLTQEEIEQLPFSGRILGLGGVSEALEDGQISKEEIKELRSDKGRHGKARGAGRHRDGGRG